MYTIIIPTKNNINYIDSCVESVIKSAKNLEYEILIGIDDCEDTKNYVLENELIKNNTELYFFNENVGPYVIKNTLFQYAKYDNIVFFDSDDIMMEDALTIIDENIEKSNCLRFKYDELKENGNITKRGWMSEGPLVIKKHIFEELKGYRPFFVGADTELKERYGKEFGKYILTDAYFLRRITKNSLTNSRTTGRSTKLRDDITKQIIELRNNGLPTPEKLHVNDCVKIN